MANTNMQLQLSGFTVNVENCEVASALIDAIQAAIEKHAIVDQCKDKCNGQCNGDSHYCSRCGAYVGHTHSSCGCSGGRYPNPTNGYFTYTLTGSRTPRKPEPVQKK